MHNEIFQAIVLGLVQGLGEFLPISSSGHLVVMPWLLDFSDPGLAFDVALHAGTLIAVLACFWQDILEIIKKAFGKTSPDHTEYNKNTIWLLAIATIPGVLAGLILEEKAETIFRNPLLVACALFLAGLVLYFADKFVRHRKEIRQVSWKDALLIGCSQALAIVPGVSRSGATITAGLFLGLSRKSAARFSFLMSAPIIFGATVLKLPELFREGLSAMIVVGVLVSAVSGYLAIKYLIKFVEKTSYRIFFWYRVALAILIVAVYFLKA